MANAWPSPPSSALRGQVHVVVVDQCVGALPFGLTGKTDIADDLDAGRVGGHEEHGHALVGGHVGIGDCHDDEERRRPGVGGEELPAVEDPLVAVAHRAGLERVGVRATLWLGHRVTREDLALQERKEVALLLCFGAVVGDDLGVAGVGRLAAEDRSGPSDELPRISFRSESLSCPCPWPPSSGPRWVAHSPWRRTCALSGSVMALRVASGGVNSSPRHSMSMGSTSVRTNSAAQSSFAWYPGSVSNSHAMAVPPLVGWQNNILSMENPSLPDDTDVVSRIARQTLAKRGPGLHRRGAPADRRRSDGHAPVRNRFRPRVADIVTEAGISNEGFYRHFASKDALVAAILDDGTERL